MPFAGGREPPRDHTSLETLARLKPAFKLAGRGPALRGVPGGNHGAAALVVPLRRRPRRRWAGSRLARIVGQAVSGLEPSMVMMTPVEAVRKLLKKTGWVPASSSWTSSS